jgi:DNA-binding GntR family transcriptional regulator
MKHKLLAEEVANALVEKTARGVFEPGQRLIETDVANALGVSRLPLREALKALESQGVVKSTPHRGTRLMPVDEERLNQINEVRLALETLALECAYPRFREDADRFKPLDRTLVAMERAARRRDRFAMAQCDVRFHYELCAASGNEVLATLWDGLKRQLTIVFGLPWLGNPDCDDYPNEHVKLRRAFDSPTLASARKALVHHIQAGWRVQRLHERKKVAQSTIEQAVEELPCCHSRAPRSGEPGIHAPRFSAEVLDARPAPDHDRGFRPVAGPGMTGSVFQHRARAWSLRPARRSGRRGRSCP